MSGINILLGISFEQKSDNTDKSFQRLLGGMFGQNGTTNLRNVFVHSDRGYMLPSLVFTFLLACGAEVLGTVKRMAGGWPFTYDQKLKPNDKRTLISTKGASMLALKWCASGMKKIFASAFRNGSGSVATAISTVHKQHHWEAILLVPRELRKYSDDPSSLQEDFFQFVCLPGLPEEEDGHAASAMEDLLEREVDPQMLQQGKFFTLF